MATGFLGKDTSSLMVCPREILSSPTSFFTAEGPKEESKKELKEESKEESKDGNDPAVKRRVWFPCF
jgi:hypothetical protein